MIAKVCYARLQVLLLLLRHLSGGGSLQFPQDPLSRTMLVFEIAALFIKPLLALVVDLEKCRGRTREVLCRMIKVQDLLVDVRTEKIPIGLSSIGNPDKARVRVERLDVLNFSIHAVEKLLFSLRRSPPQVNLMQTLAVAIIQRDAPRLASPPLLIADQHAGTVDADADRRNLAFQL